MKQKSIVVPIDEEASNALNYNEATQHQLIELFLSEKEFNALWEMNFFDLINQIAKVNIDKYEDEIIADEQKLKALLNSSIFTNNGNVDKIEEIKKLIEEAIVRKTAVYFFF